MYYNIACNPMGVVWVVEFTGIKLKYPRWVARYVIVHLPDLMQLLLACSGTIWDNEFSLVYKKTRCIVKFRWLYLTQAFKERKMYNNLYLTEPVCTYLNLSLNLSKSIQSYPNLPNVFKPMPTYLKLSYPLWACSNLSKPMEPSI